MRNDFRGFSGVRGMAARILAAGISLLGPVGSAAEVGETSVLKWKDGKEAVMLISFDDSCPTHLTAAIPELEKRGLVGNFYIVPGKGTYVPKKKEWEEAVKSPAVAIQNHSFTHSAVTSAEQMRDELTKANEVIKELLPEKKWPRLIGWARPGGVKWEVDPEEDKKMLEEFHLIVRPKFWGPPIHHKSAADCVAEIDKAIAKGEMGHLDLHGVGGDWLVTPLDWYTAILDKLVEEKDRVWTADFVDYHKYLTQRESARVEVLQTVARGVRLTLKSDADPAFYDFPLTLETQVPADWKECVVKQGEVETTVPVVDGVVRYAAIPGGDEIRLIAK